MGINPASRLPALPVELWIRVLECLNHENDRGHLWMSCRNVCTAFRETVQRIFREKHLPKTWISYDLGVDYLDDDSRVKLDVEFKFLRLSDDRTKAIFGEDCCAEEHKSMVRRRLKNQIAAHDIEDPKHVIQIRRDVNDTPIPAFQVNYDKLEVSCDWQGLFTAFFREEQLCFKLQGDWVGSKMDWISEVRGKITSGELDWASTMMQAIEAYGKLADEARRTARRARVTQQFMEWDGTEWDAERDWDLAEERAVMKRLSQRAKLAALEDDSDEEAEEVSGISDTADDDDDDDGEWESILGEDSDGELP